MFQNLEGNLTVLLPFASASASRSLRFPFSIVIIYNDFYNQNKNLFI